MTVQISPQSEFSSSQSEPNKRHWLASLAVNVDYKNQRSFVSFSKHCGPLRIQRPFYPEGQQTCHLYVLHPPGGLVPGDELELDFSIESNAHALLTTPSAGKFYQTDRWQHPQQQNTRLTLSHQSICEWLPQETIFFDKANAELHNVYNLEQDSKLITWEILCFGRKHGDFPFTAGNVSQDIRVIVDNEPLFIEKNRFEASTPIMSERWGLANNTVQGTLIAYGFKEQLPESLYQLGNDKNPLLAFTQMGPLLICRYLGNCTQEAKQLFTEVWQFIRPNLLNLQAEIPRIWHT